MFSTPSISFDARAQLDSACVQLLEEDRQFVIHLPKDVGGRGFCFVWKKGRLDNTSNTSLLVVSLGFVLHKTFVSVKL